MTDSLWDKSTDDDWSDASAWSPQVVPNDTAAVVKIAAPGTYTVTIAYNESETVGALDLANAGTVLQLNGTLALGGSTAGLTLDSGSLDLRGTLSGGTLIGHGGRLVVDGGTLSNIKLAGTIAAANSYDNFHVAGGLSGGGTLDLTNPGLSLYADTTETFDTLTALLGDGGYLRASGNIYDSTAGTYAGSTLTLGASFDLRQNTGASSYLTGYYAKARIINAGTIEALGRYLEISPASFANAGTIAIGATSTLRSYGSFTNTGVISIAAGGTLQLAGSESLASLGSIANAGLLDIYYGGSLDLGGGTLTLAPNTAFASLELQGTIANGTLLGAGGKLVVDGGTLSNIKLAGTIAAANSYDNFHVIGGLSGGGTLDLTNPGLSLYADTTETFDSLTVLLGGGNIYASGNSYDSVSGGYVGSTLTLGPNVDLRQSAGAYSYLRGYYSTSKIINQGTIEALGSYFEASPASFVNAGTIAIGTSDSFRAYGSFANTGLITIAAGGTLQLAGSESLASLGSIANAGLLDIYYGGSLDLGGGTLTLAPNTAFASLELQGTIANGTLLGAGGKLVVDGGTLSGVKLAGTIAAANSYDGFAVLGGLSGGGTLDLTNPGLSLYAASNESFDSLTVLLGGGNIYASGNSYDSTAGTYAGSTLTLGPALDLRQSTGAYSYLRGYYSTSKIINQGTIEALGSYFEASPASFVNAGTIAIGTSDSFRAYGSFANTGLITIAAGGTLQLAGSESLASLGSIANAGLLDIYYGGSLDLGGGTLTLAPNTAFASLELQGTIANGTFLGAGGKLVVDGGTLSGVKLAGTIAAANSYDGFAVLGGLSGGGTLDLTNPGLSLYAANNESFDSLTVLLGGGNIYASGNSYDSTAGTYAGSTLTLGPALDLRQSTGGYSYLRGYYNNSKIINQGTIEALGSYFEASPGSFVNAGTIILGTTDSFRVYGSFANTGLIEATAAGTAAATFTTLTGLAAGTLGGGTIAALHGATLNLTLGALPTVVAGEIDLDGTGSAIGVVDPVTGNLRDLGGVVTTIGAGGRLVLSNGATFSTGALTVAAGGTIFGAGTVAGTLTDNGMVEAHGGTLAVDLAGSGTLAIDPGAALSISGAASSGLTVDFGGAGATLILDDLSDFGATLSHLGTDSVIDLKGISVTGGTIVGNSLILYPTGGGSKTIALVNPGAGLDTAFFTPGAGGGTLSFGAAAEVFAAARLDLLSGPGTLTRSGDNVSVDLGNLRQGPGTTSVELGVVNVAASGTDSLSGGFTTLGAAPFSTSGFANFTALAPGATHDAGGVTIAKSGAGGSFTEYVTLDATSNGATTKPLNPEIATLTGTLFELATPSLSTTTLDLGAVRASAGATLSGQVTLANGTTASSFKEKLDYNVGTVSAPASLAAATAASGTLAAGSSVALGFALDAGNAGALSSGPISIGVSSDGIGIDGFTAAALAPLSLSVIGNAYATAQPTGFSTVNLGVLHTNQSASGSDTISNTKIASLQDSLLGSLASSTSLTSSPSFFNIVAGSSQTLNFGLDTSATGAHAARASYTLSSHDSQLTDVAAGTGTVEFDYEVHNPAQAKLALASGVGALSASSATSYLLDFGTLALGGGPVNAVLDVANIAASIADVLDGSYSGVSASPLFGSLSGSFNDLANGAAPDLFSAITFDPSQAGSFTDTITVHLASDTQSASGSVALPDVIVTVHANVVSGGGGGGGGGTPTPTITPTTTVSPPSPTVSPPPTPSDTPTPSSTPTPHTPTPHTPTPHTPTPHTPTPHTPTPHTPTPHTPTPHTPTPHTPTPHTPTPHTPTPHTPTPTSTPTPTETPTPTSTPTPTETPTPTSTPSPTEPPTSTPSPTEPPTPPPSPTMPPPSPPPSIPPTPPGPGPGGNGDVHLYSANGTRFDYQGVGEFTLIKNTHLDVQVRLEPRSYRADQPTGSVSVITQTAVKIGDDRITFDITRASPLWINGAAITLLPGQFIKLATTTLYANNAGAYIIQANTGEQVQLSSQHVTVWLDNNAGGASSGLLGSSTNASTFLLPDGTALSNTPDYDTLYHVFGDAWRVTTATSLFDYDTDPDTGLPEDTNSPQITNLDFPAVPVSLSNLPQSVIDQATSAVSGLGITDPQQLQNAIYDYILGGGDKTVVASDLAAQNAGQTGGTQATITNPPPARYLGVLPPDAAISVNGTAGDVLFSVYRSGDVSAPADVSWRVVAAGGNSVTAAEYGGVLPSGTITIAAGATSATIDVRTPGSLVLPNETLELSIATTTTGERLLNSLAFGTLTTSLPVRGKDASPEFYKLSSFGTLTAGDTLSVLDLGTIGADGIGTLTVGLLNDVESWGDSLRGTLSLASGGGIPITGLGTISLTPGAASPTIKITPQRGSIGDFTETLVLHAAESNASGYSGALPDEYLVIKANVVDPTARPAELPDTQTIYGRVGGTFSPGITIANTAPPGSDKLIATLTDTGGHVVVADPLPLPATASSKIAFSLAPGVVGGTFTDLLDIGYISHDSGTAGLHADITLPGDSITLVGSVFAPAVASLGTTVLNFGTVHQRATSPVLSLSVANTATGPLTDDLIIAAHNVGNFSSSDTLDIAAGSTAALHFSLDTSQGGTVSATETLSLASRDAYQSDARLASRTVRLTGTVMAYATAGFVQVAGPKPVYSSPAVIDYGQVPVGYRPITFGFAVANTAQGLADTMSGTLSLLHDGTTTVLGTVSNVAAGTKSAEIDYVFDPTTVGSISDELIFNGISVSSMGTATLSQTMLEIIGSVVPCFCPGTQIATPDGERAVETLAIGDLVLTASGEARAIRWIGRRVYEARIAARSSVLAPVRIGAGALGGGLPRRDLDVSPLHAMFIDGVLVKAERLVNGVTITRPVPEGEVRYIHLELDSHDILLAEGAATESYVDCGNREMFHNHGEFAALYPHAQVERFACCAELCEGGERLAAIRRAIDARAGLAPDLAQGGTLAGHLDEADRHRLRGWAWQAEHPDTPARLTVFDGDEALGETIANRPRPDVAAAGFGDGHGGFEFSFDPPLSPFRSHRLRVCRSADGAQLQGSPRVLEPALRMTAAERALIERSLRTAEAGGSEEIEATLAMLARATEQLLTARAGAARPRSARPSRRTPARSVAIVIDDRLPATDRDAGSQALTSHAESLGRLGYQVILVPADGEASEAAVARWAARGIRVCARPHTPSPEAALREHGAAATLVYLHRIDNFEAYGALARRYCPAARLLYSVADLHFLRLARQAQAQGDPSIAARAARMRSRELAAAASADRVLTHSPVEAALLRRALADDASVHVVPWAITPPGRAAKAGPGAMRGDSVLFVGGLRHAPNLDAASWLACEIMPRVWRERPEMICTIAGEDPPPALRAMASEQLRIAGHVPDLAALYGLCSASLAPLRFGAGIKGKVLDSLAAGRAVIGTPIAFEGLELPSEACFIAEDADGLAAAILRCAGDKALATAAGAAGQRAIRAGWTKAQLDRALEAAVDGCVADGRAAG